LTLNSPAASTLYSRRRHRARSSTVPDWIWGAGLGVLFIFVIGAFFATRELTGSGGSGTCDEALPPLPGSSVGATAFIEEEVALDRVISMLDAGDRAGAEAAFFGPVHGFTHNIDPLLREQDEEAAMALCEAVIKLEDSLATGAANATVAMQIDGVRVLLRDAAETLGYPRPG